MDIYDYGYNLVSIDIKLFDGDVTIYDGKLERSLFTNNDKTKTDDKEQEIKYDSESEMHLGNMNISDTTKANTGNFVFTAQQE